MKKYWYVFILCFSLNMAIAQNGVQFIEDKTWEEVLAIAGKENKIVFLDAYTTWCGPCKKMSNEVFPLTQVGNYFNEKFGLNLEFGGGNYVSGGKIGISLKL